MNAYRRLCGCLLALLTVSLLDFHRAGAAPFDAKATTQAAETAFVRKDYNQVVELLMPHLAELPRDSVITLGKAQSELKNQTAAIKVFSAGLSQNPKDVELKSLLGFELYKSGKDHEGMVILKEVVEASPKYLQAYRFLIQIYEKRKNKYELRLIYQDLVEKFGEKSDFITKLCGLTSLEGFHELALKYCTLGIQLNPREPENYVYLGLSNKDTGKTEEAVKNLKKAADSFSKSELAQLSYAQYLEEKKNYIQAFAYYQRAVANHKDSSVGWVGLGNAGLEIQKLQESLAAFETACQLDKKTLPAFRRATNTLRLAKNEVWKKKFEISLEKCAK